MECVLEDLIKGQHEPFGVCYRKISSKYWYNHSWLSDLNSQPKIVAQVPKKGTQLPTDLENDAVFFQFIR